MLPQRCPTSQRAVATRLPRRLGSCSLISRACVPHRQPHWHTPRMALGRVAAAAAAAFGRCLLQFIVRDDPQAGSRDVAGVDWEFNAWGGAEGGLYPSWDRDQKVAATILQVLEQSWLGQLACRLPWLWLRRWCSSTYGGAGGGWLESGRGWGGCWWGIGWLLGGGDARLEQLCWSVVFEVAGAVMFICGAVGCGRLLTAGQEGVRGRGGGSRACLWGGESTVADARREGAEPGRWPRQMYTPPRPPATADVHPPTACVHPPDPRRSIVHPLDPGPVSCTSSAGPLPSCLVCLRPALSPPCQPWHEPPPISLFCRLRVCLASLRRWCWRAAASMWMGRGPCLPRRSACSTTTATQGSPRRRSRAGWPACWACRQGAVQAPSAHTAPCVRPGVLAAHHRLLLW